MKTLKITLSLSPSRGPSIPKQACHYFKTDRGLPAIRVRWETLFKKYEETFVFQTQATLVYPIGAKGAKFAYKFNTGPSLSVLGMASGGIVGGVIGFASELALGAAKTAPQGLDGIGVIWLSTWLLHYHIWELSSFFADNGFIGDRSHLDCLFQ